MQQSNAPKYRWLDGSFMREEIEVPPGSNPRIPVTVREVCGARGFGTIHHFRQVHLIRGQRDVEYDTLDKVAEIQAAILRELVRYRFRVVIPEDWTVILPPGHPKREELLGEEVGCREVREFFPTNEIPEMLSPEQKQVVARGAAQLYAALFGDVTLHQSCTPAEMNRNMDLGIQYSEDRETMMRLSMEWRDLWVIREACSALRMHGISQVAVIFGAAHRFTRADFPPTIADHELPDVISHSWPLLDRDRMDEELEIRNCTDPALQESLVERATALTEWCFASLMTERARQLALPKLYPWQPDYDSPYRHNSPDEVLSFLLKPTMAFPLSDKIQAELRAMHEARERLFAPAGYRRRTGG